MKTVTNITGDISGYWGGHWRILRILRGIFADIDGDIGGYCGYWGGYLRIFELRILRRILMRCGESTLIHHGADTGWRKPRGCVKVQDIFRKSARVMRMVQIGECNQIGELLSYYTLPYLITLTLFEKCSFHWSDSVGARQLRAKVWRRAPRALLRKMTCKDKASYGSWPLCIEEVWWMDTDSSHLLHICTVLIPLALFFFHQNTHPHLKYWAHFIKMSTAYESQILVCISNAHEILSISVPSWILLLCSLFLSLTYSSAPQISNIHHTTSTSAPRTTPECSSASQVLNSSA